MMPRSCAIASARATAWSSFAFWRKVRLAAPLSMGYPSTCSITIAGYSPSSTTEKIVTMAGS